MKFETIYLVFRHYSEKERVEMMTPSWIASSVHLYGWSPSKDIVRGFMKQRSQKKYSVRKIDIDELDKYLTMSQSRENLMIDMLPIKSCKSNEEFILFMTEEEKKKAENKIIQLVTHTCSLDRIITEGKSNSSISTFINILVNLKQEYQDSLYYLGYRPKEQSYMYDDVQEHYGDYDYSETYDCRGKEPSGFGIGDPFKINIYTLESMIMVLREEM